jgi:hypothetical protein
LVGEITLIVQQSLHFAGLGADDRHEAVAGGQAERVVAVEAGRDFDDEHAIARHVRRLHVTIAGRIGETEMAYLGDLRLARAEATEAGFDSGKRRVFIESFENLRELHDSHGRSLNGCCRTL